MTAFNFSKPKPVKTNDKKVPWWEKIWAGLSLISLFGDSIIPKKGRDYIPIPVRNMAVLFLIIIILYLVACGAIMNTRWIIGYVKDISFSFGNWFYYFGFMPVIFLLIDCFYLDEKLLDHLGKKNQISSAIKNLSNGVASIPSVKPVAKNKVLSIVTSISTFFTALWLIWGIIFYDRILFIGLIGLSVLFSIITSIIKDSKKTKYIFFIEIIINIISILFIIINHFYLNIL